MMKRRIVVTGLGMLSPLANNVEDSWQAILAGKSGIRLIDFFDTEQLSSKISGSVRNFDTDKYFEPKEARKLGLFLQYGIAAAVQAVKDADLKVSEDQAPRAGTVIGAGMCGMPLLSKSHEIMLNSGPRRLSPFFIPAIITNMLSGLVSIRFGLKGPNLSIVTACATGTHNIGTAARFISYGDADVVVCGGAEMSTCRLGVGGFCAMRSLSKRNDEPEKASRPWDKDRDGFVMGDGAGIMVLEELERAKKRGAKIYAELAGFGMSGDAHHITAPSVDGQMLSMQNALHDANLKPEDIDYINAHGTSTLIGDISEVDAIKKLFGSHAYKLAVSSTKSMTGHLLGATGAIEAIFSILAIRDQIAPPTINLDNPDEGCDLNFVPHRAQPKEIKIALSNSFGFGGTNGTLIFKKFVE
ncbi:MAG: beta-ketoacyl-ACP synthase II [Gammaproteobacteria bacterium]